MRLSKILSLATAILMIASMNISVFATNNPSTVEQELLITRHFTSINSDSWETWASCYAPSIRSSYANFATNPNNQKENIGILTVDNVEIIDIVKLNNDVAPRYPELQNYYDNNNFDCFKVSMNLSVNEETKYFQNGYQERLVILVQEGDDWYIGASSGYSSKNRGIGTGFLDGDVDNPPSTIIVGQHDNSTWNEPSVTGKPQEVDFDTFVRTVVYGEIGVLNYESDAIKAITVSDRMFSWYCVLGSYRDTFGCDIVGGYDVAYYPENEGKGSSSFKQTVNSALNNYVLSSTGKFFSVGANNMTKFDKPGSGHVVQSGAQRLAKNGKSWKEILHYYLDDSSYNWPNAGTVIIG